MVSPIQNEQINNFFGCPIRQGENNTITFTNADLQINFISYNQAMWDYFKPELTKRLSELSVDDSTSARVRSALTELFTKHRYDN